MKWLRENSESLGKKYDNQWLVIGPKGVLNRGNSYANAVKNASESTVLVKVPRHPATAYFY